MVLLLSFITVIAVIAFVLSTVAVLFVPTVALALNLVLVSTVVAIGLTEDLAGTNPFVPLFRFSKLDCVGAVTPSPAVDFETGFLPLFQTLATRLLAAVVKSPNFEEGLDLGARSRTSVSACDSDDGVLTSWTKFGISHRGRFRSSSKNSSNRTPPLRSTDF